MVQTKVPLVVTTLFAREHHKVNTKIIGALPLPFSKYRTQTKRIKSNQTTELSEWVDGARDERGGYWVGLDQGMDYCTLVVRDEIKRRHESWVRDRIDKPERGIKREEKKSGR